MGWDNDDSIVDWPAWWSCMIPLAMVCATAIICVYLSH